MTKIQWKYGHGAIERDVITQVEERFGVQFPQEYVEVALQHHGAAAIPNTFDVDVYGEAVFNRVLSYDPSKPNYIVDVYEGVKDRLLEGVYPFASDAFGNLICFDYRQLLGKDPQQPAIVLWDHEAASEIPVNALDEDALYEVTSSFHDLMNSLYELEE